jgi:hypothetical protein
MCVIFTIRDFPPHQGNFSGGGGPNGLSASIPLTSSHRFILWDLFPGPKDMMVNA